MKEGVAAVVRRGKEGHGEALLQRPCPRGGAYRHRSPPSRHYHVYICNVFGML